MRTLAAAIFLALALPSISFADTYVRGYTKKDGTYVAPHFRSSPDNNIYNNYSSEGQTNPYTAKKGSQRHEYSTQPKYQKDSPLYTPDASDTTLYGNQKPKKQNSYRY